jgi:Protein of unknown function (DUF2769).
MEKIIVTAEKAVGCRCSDCATFKMQGLETGVFCANGQSPTEVKETNGCDCQGCPVREEGNFGHVEFCAGTQERFADRTVEKVEVERVDADVTVQPVGADSGHVPM